MDHTQATNEIGNMVLKSCVRSLIQLSTDKGINYSDENAKATIKDELPASIQTIIKDAKEAQEAFLNPGFVTPMTKQVFSVGVTFEGLRIAKKILNIS